MIEITMHGEAGNIAELRLNRPPVNALNLELIEALMAAHREALTNKAQAIVISGKEGMYSGGLDVPELMQASSNTMAVFWKVFANMCHTLISSKIPVIAAVTGHAPAGGAVIALHCDYRVAALGDFKIGLNEVQVGLALPRRIYDALEYVLGSRQASLLAMQGKMLTMQEAYDVGFVDELVDVGDVVTRAVAFAEGLLRLPPEAMNITRTSAKPASLLRAPEAAEIRQLSDNWFSEETQATMQALVQSLQEK